jgi:transglutaminase-like putative cysteine protease
MDDVQLDRRNGGRELYVDQVYEPLSVASLEEAGRYQFVFNPEFETLTIHRVDVLRDGKWTTRLDPDRITLARRETDFEADMATGAVTALLDLADIRLGDRIRVAYSVKGSNPVLAGLDHDEFSVGWTTPLLLRRIRVLFDKTAQPTVQRDAGVAEGQVSQTADGQEYVEEEHDLPSAHEEGDDPAWYSPHPREEIARMHSWADIAHWAVGLYPPPKPLPADLMQRIAEWKHDPDPASRVAKALHAVQDEVRYFGIELGENSHRPAEPADVWTHRQGDCKDKTRLPVAILAQMGIASQPALVSSDGGPRLLHVPPSASAFDHVIVRAQVNGHDYWLDPTRTQQRGSLDDAAVSNFGHALVVEPDTRGLVPVMQSPGSTAHWRISETFAPDADGRNTRLEVVTEASGNAAEQVRGRFATNTREKIQKDYSDYYSRRIPGLASVEPLRMEDDAATNTVTTHEAYMFKGALTPDADMLTLDTYAEGIGSYLQMPKTMSRHAPLALSYPVDVEERIALKLPPKWEWRGEAMQKTIDAPGVVYSIATSQQGNDIVFLHRYHSTAAVVDVPQMTEHLAARRAIDDLVSRRFLLASPTNLAAQQRDERLQHLLKGIMDDPGSADPKSSGK